MEKVKRTTEVASNIGRGCEHCHDGIGALHDSDDITGSINHYIEKHGYRLLHIGTQTSHDNDGKLWHSTVAILGHDDPPAILPPPVINIGDVFKAPTKPK